MSKKQQEILRGSGQGVGGKQVYVEFQKQKKVFPRRRESSTLSGAAGKWDEDQEMYFFLVILMKIDAGEVVR